MRLRMTVMYGHGVALTCLHNCQPVSAQSPFITINIHHSPPACLGAGISPLGYFVTAREPPCHIAAAASVPGSRHVTHTSLHSFLAPPCLQNSQAATPLLYWSQTVSSALSWHWFCCVHLPPPTLAHRGESSAFRSHDLEGPHSDFSNETNYSNRKIP